MITVAAAAALAGCSGGSFLAEREPWRKQAEARCMGAGTVREGNGVARIAPINGPGTCGADFPLKVSSLGISSALGFGEMRPPGAIPNSSRPAQMPRWPVNDAAPGYETAPLRNAPVQARPLPPPSRGVAEPVSLDPPPQSNGGDSYDFRAPYRAANPPPAARSRRAAPGQSPGLDLSPEPYDQRRVFGGERDAMPDANPYDMPPPESARASRSPARNNMPLGPSPSRSPTMASAAVKFTPAATLGCPMVAAVDEWIANSIQPAAVRWFGQPVIEIRQISAYSCRGMNGNPNARISEHAFGNALDVASFTIADGRRITVKGGWKGTPEEQGFLRDVQAGACDRFTTVLAPGSNVFHYDHFHVDLMRRANGRRACNPRAVSGEEVAARARGGSHAGRGEPPFTGSVRKGVPKRGAPTAFAAEGVGGKTGHILPMAVPGADGED